MCLEEETIPLFSQPWWLDAVCGPDNWDVVVDERHGHLFGSMPYYLANKRVIAMPMLTQTMGPWIRPSQGKYSTALSHEMEVMSGLISQLPKVWHFRQNFHPFVTNWLPFFWKGYQQTTQYTYRIDDISDLDTVWQEMDNRYRSSIRKAQNSDISVGSDFDSDCFLRVIGKTFQRQNISVPVSKAAFDVIYQASRKNQAGKMFFASDSDGRIHAAGYLVWTQSCSYYLMGGADPDLRASGAQNLLMWEMIRFASTVSKGFDFEGSMIPGVESSFRKFGARQTPYFCVFKGNNLVTFLIKARRFIRKVLK